MTVVLDSPTRTQLRDPVALLNAVRPHIREYTYNVLESPGSVGVTIWEREIKLLMRDNVMVRDMAERILGQAVAYTLTAMERRDVHIGVGKTVDIGVHQLLLDTPVYFALCEVYNGGKYKHHAPLIERRRDGLVGRTADVVRESGFAVDDELWAMDDPDCSPCDDKVPDSH
ncbi:hypothetical protein [Streptomyces kanamyceticus]|uniref:Uncharacterized protein n=1 Tax=Streptomyces kanamyceticus TaxID=1967 RepID=A0A5J6GEK0_STRKN|nr:hypothetical protein [Streptomyces kanamyceticus]QEU93533.1 hypothetical protein CP970_23835 [Streptomyces kanamyceticus]